MNNNFCNCTVKSHMAIRGELLTQIGDEVSLNQQSDIENDLEQRLSEFDINLENPNFSLAGEEIKIAHIKESSVKIKLKNILESYDEVFSRSKFDVGCCNLVNTKIPLTSDTAKFWEPERRIRPEEFQQVETLIKELLEYNIIALAD